MYQQSETGSTRVETLAALKGEDREISNTMTAERASVTLIVEEKRKDGGEKKKGEDCISGRRPA